MLDVYWRVGSGSVALRGQARERAGLVEGQLNGDALGTEASARPCCPSEMS